MKKIIKKLFAGVSAIAVLMTGMTVVSAETTEYTGIDTDEYRDYVNNTLYEIPNKDMVFEMFFKNHKYTYDPCSSKYGAIYGEFVDVHLADDPDSTSSEAVTYMIEEYEQYYFDYEFALFSDEIIHYDTYKIANPEFTSEEFSEFLTENDFKATVKEFAVADDGTTVTLAFDDDMTVNDAEKMAYVIYKTYGILPTCTSFLLMTFFGNKEFDKLDYNSRVNEFFSTAFGTVVTLAGDIDLNNEQGISDIVTLTKFNTSSDLYPISDPTALANADMNRDGAVNVLDASILIEMALGTYESAV